MNADGETGDTEAERNVEKGRGKPTSNPGKEQPFRELGGGGRTGAEGGGQQDTGNSRQRAQKEPGLEDESGIPGK